MNADAGMHTLEEGSVGAWDAVSPLSTGLTGTDDGVDERATGESGAVGGAGDTASFKSSGNVNGDKGGRGGAERPTLRRRGNRDCDGERAGAPSSTGEMEEGDSGTMGSSKGSRRGEEGKAAGSERRWPGSVALAGAGSVTVRLRAPAATPSTGGGAGGTSGEGEPAVAERGR